MTLTGSEKLEKFSNEYPHAKTPLRRWKRIIQENRFKRFLEFRQTFGRATDLVDEFTVFDIGGNKYRLIAVVDHDIQLCVVHSVLTHEEYERWSKK